jgi:hypothetical protein
LIPIVFLVDFLNFLEWLQFDFFKIVERSIMADNLVLVLLVEVGFRSQGQIAYRVGVKKSPARLPGFAHFLFL